MLPCYKEKPMSPVEYIEPYSELASAYDYILQGVDYQGWYRYIREVMLRYVPEPKLILELGCGTGRFGAKFSADNYTVFGMDVSLDMVRVAKARAFKNFRVFCGDITCFSLAKTPDFIFAVHDTMNYFLDLKEVQGAIASVRSVMSDETIFMFDVTTEYNMQANFHGQTMIFDVRGRDVEWSNRYDPAEKHMVSTLRFYNHDGTCLEENHHQRIYTVKEIKEVLRRERMEILGIFGDYTFEAPQPETVMINFIVRKK